MHPAILGWKKKYIKGTVIRSVAEFQEVLEKDGLVYIPLWNAPVVSGWIMGFRYRDIVRMIDKGQVYTAKLKSKGEKEATQ